MPAVHLPDLGRDAAAEVVAASLWQAGARSVTVGRDGGVRGVFDERQPLEGPWPHGAHTWRPVGADPMAAWHAASQPVHAGSFEVVPSHLADHHEPSAGLLRIVLDAGMAFGTGHHETTAGCLAALSGLALQGARVVDVGTGSGVLAIAAAMLGAAHVAAVDVDPTAVEVARANSRGNDVEVVVAQGSTDVLRAAQHEPSTPGLAGPWDVVLANLLTGTLVDLAQDLHDLAAPGGILVASGTSIEHAAAVATALDGAGFVDLEVRPATRWAVVVGRRAGPDPRQSGRRATDRNSG